MYLTDLLKILMLMLYIYQTACISPQSSFPDPDLDRLHESAGNKLYAREPPYLDIPPGILRRMGRAVRMGIGAALPLLPTGTVPAGIILGTANGGMEDCIRFLNQIIEYEEGMLTPGNFVQSTPNAIAAQIGLIKKNTAYNITHVHRGLAFENALIDARMLAKDHPASCFLVGAVDEISTYNFNIDRLGGWYKKEEVSNTRLFVSNSPASIAGEGSAMFLVGGAAGRANVALEDIQTFHHRDIANVRERWGEFLTKHAGGLGDTGLLLSGENGDSRLLPYYQSCESALPSGMPIARFKHMSGEYPTASAMALWLAYYFLTGVCIPDHMIRRPGKNQHPGKILIYNNYKGVQHSFMLVSSVP